MVDPVASQQAQILSQLTKSPALKSLLQQGDARGTVLSSQGNGKTVISFQGRLISLDLPQQNLQQGQQVLAKLVGDQLSLQLLPSQKQAGSGPETAASKPLATVLANMGLSGSNVEVIAQAMLNAGIPLDRNAIKELANVLPQIQQHQLDALSFLMNRGLPISQSILFWVAHLLTPKTKPHQSLEKLINTMKEWEAEVDEEEEPIITDDARRNLRKQRENLEQRLPHFQSHSDSANREELEDMEEHIRSLLASPEAILQHELSFGKDSLGEILVQLLTQLLDIYPQLAGTKHAEQLFSLINQTMSVHETLAGQALQNLPQQDPQAAPVFFIQIPVREQNEFKNLELRYKPQDEDQKAGTLDLRFDLSNLGPMTISLQWHHPNISLSFLVSDEKIREFLEPALDQLQNALTEMNFHVTSLSVKVGNVPETLKPIDESQTFKGKSGFDIRV